MDRNVGGIDRILRIVTGLAFVVALARPVGLRRRGASANRWCPLSPMIGINTCPMKKS